MKKINQPLLDAIKEIQEYQQSLEIPAPRRMSQNVREVGKQLIPAIAKATVLINSQAHKSEYIELALPYLEPEYRDQVNEYIVRASGGKNIVTKCIKKGYVDIADELGLWTPDFMYGLQLSGLLRQRTKPNDSYYRVRSDRAFIQDFDNSTIPHRFSKHGNGLEYLHACPLMLMPPKGKKGEQLAGLFAGARIVGMGESAWLSLPKTDEVTRLLSEWSIPWSESSSPDPNQQEDEIRVSPFYAALFSCWMPKRMAREVLVLKRPAQCPELAATYYQRILGRRYRQVIHYANALPFGCSRSSFFRLGWRRFEITKRGILELKVTHIHRGLRRLIEAWYEAADEGREKNLFKIRKKMQRLLI